MSLGGKIKRFNESNNYWVVSLRDSIFVITLIAVFAFVSQIAFGFWIPMAVVKSGSMYPDLQTGDIILIQGINHTRIITYETGEQTGYTSFGDYGDVILYKRFGKEGTIPITHRAMYYVEKGEPMWADGPPAPHAGYITKGDNTLTNPLPDQMGDISYLQPIKKEWVIGVARFHRIPRLGYIVLIPRKILGL